MGLNFTEEPAIEYHKQGTVYKFYNYAILHSLGFHHIFEVMRYNRAFLCRLADVHLFQQVAMTPLNYLGRMGVLLCKYDWRGKTKPTWSYDQLLSDQELQEITDPLELFSLNPEFSEWHARPTLKYEARCRVTGTIHWVLDVMYKNKAVPFDETDSRTLEDALGAGDPQRSITLVLMNFVAAPGKWIFPPQPAPKS